MHALDDAIRQVIAGTFDVAPETVDERTCRETLAAWDSLGQISLVMALEERFDVGIDVEHIASLTSFAAVRDLLESLQAAVI